MPADAIESCARDRDCDDGLFCTGVETCRPGADGADARGCVAAGPPCMGECDEGGRRCPDECDGLEDMDGDGHASLACGGADCDDENAEIHPGAPELCNMRDDDCDAVIDEALEERPQYPDADSDGAGDALAAPTLACSALPGFVANAGDCDDTRADVHPGADERCNGVDDDCDSTVDEDARSSCGGECGEDCSGATLAMSYGTVCALEGGVPHCWGRASRVAGHPNVALREGELEEGAPVRIPITDAVTLAATGSFACAVRSDGTLRCWGANTHGNLGVGDTAPHATPQTPVGLVDAVGVAVSRTAVCAVDRGGLLWCWGGNTSGQLGDGTRTARTVPTLVPSLSDVVEVAGAGNAFCALTRAGEVWCWGAGPTGDGLSAGGPPRRVLEGASALRMGGANLHFACAAREGGWWCWGDQLAIESGGPTRVDVATRVPELDGAVNVAIGAGFACSVAADHSVACWGNADMMDEDPALGRTHFPPVPTGLRSVDGLTCGTFGCCGRIAGALRCRGHGYELFFGDGEPRIHGPMIGVGLSGARTMALMSLGGSAACLVDRDGRLGCYGTLAGVPEIDHLPGGAGTYLTPMLVPSVTEPVAEVALYVRYTCARTTAGEVWCGGGSAAPGDGSLSRVVDTRRVDASGMGALRSITAGDLYACGVAASTGHAWCWGARDDFSAPFCGDGPTTSRCYVPVEVAGGHEFRALDAGRLRVCGVTTGGSLFCWGHEGSGLAAIAHEPVAVGTFTDIDEVTVGESHLCVRRGGRVSCIGMGTDGQLGDGRGVRSEVFVDVVGLSDAVSVQCANHSCVAQRADGSYVGWGEDRGVLGAATRDAERHAPVPAAHGLLGELWLGASNACLRREDGEIVCWGVENNWQVRALPRDSTRGAF